jgi:hypothetical protein
MLTCDKCGKPKTVMVRVKIYLGEDPEWGNQYYENWRCIPCLLATPDKVASDSTDASVPVAKT